MFSSNLEVNTKYLDELHQKSQVVRNPYKIKTIKLKDGKVDCIFFNQNNQKIKNVFRFKTMAGSSRFVSIQI